MTYKTLERIKKMFNPKIDYLGFFGEDDKDLLMRVRVGKLEETLPWNLKKRLEIILDGRERVSIKKIRVPRSAGDNFMIGAKNVNIGYIFSEDLNPYLGDASVLRFSPSTRIRVGDVYAHSFLKEHEGLEVFVRNVLGYNFLGDAVGCHAKVSGYVGDKAGYSSKSCTIHAKFAGDEFLAYSKYCEGRVEVCRSHCGSPSVNLKLEVKLYGDFFLSLSKNTFLKIPAIIEEFENILKQREVKKIETKRREPLESVLMRYKEVIKFFRSLIESTVFENVKIDKEYLMGKLGSGKYDNFLVGYLSDLDVETLEKLRLFLSSYAIPRYVDVFPIRLYYTRFSEREIEEMSLLCGLWRIISYDLKRFNLSGKSKDLIHDLNYSIEKLLLLRRTSGSLGVGDYFILLLNSIEYLLEQIKKGIFKRIWKESVIV